MAERTPNRTPATSRIGTHTFTSDYNREVVPPSPLLNSRSGNTAVPGNAVPVTMHALDNAFDTHLAEAQEQRQQFLLSSSERAPTKAEIETMLSQTDIKFKLLHEDTMEYARRMEATFQAKILDMQWGIQQLEREMLRLSLFAPASEQARITQSPPVASHPNARSHGETRHHQAGAFSPGGGGAGIHQISGHQQPAPGHPTIRAARSYPTLSSFPPSFY